MRRLFPFLPLAVFASGLYGCGYNEMQAKEEAVFAAWGDVEAAYQRRADLVPNLVEVVKGYAKHEHETLTAVTEAGQRWGPCRYRKRCSTGPDAVARYQQAHRSSARPFAAPCRCRAIPEPEGEPEFHRPQNQLEGTENRINVARVALQ